ncbi:prepilin-type N-terminal cleavage/methylation domain-containing protein [Patescibacteria group bacterium]|nr:MAG: prepilin-type N-terminal cleavage/methylation domain-containing protein [Patescibacteria group bacterium]
MDRRGYTIIELIIVIAIMGILITLAVVNLRGSQANARDTERRGDVASIALNLENFYANGTAGSSTFGRYVSTSIIGQETTGLPDIDVRSLVAPGVNLTPNANGVSTSPTPDSSLIAATCSGVCVQTTAGVTPQPTTSTYVYQPLQADGTLCTNGTQDCRKFNIYFALENAAPDCPAPNNICMVTSKNQ